MYKSPPKPPLLVLHVHFQQMTGHELLKSCRPVLAAKRTLCAQQ